MKTLIQSINEHYFPNSYRDIFLTFNEPEINNGKEFKVFKTLKGLSEINQTVDDFLHVIMCETKNILNEDVDKALIINYNQVLKINFWEFISRYCSNTDLSYLNAPRSDLKGAMFEACNLSYTNFSGANLERASLERSVVHFASFERANLSYTNLHATDFTSSDLRRCDLKNSDARKAKFDKSALRGTELWGALLWNCSFEKSFISGVDLTRGDYRGDGIV